MPGTYRETVYIDKDNITLSGVIEQGKYPVLEGEGLRNDAVLYSGIEDAAIYVGMSDHVDVLFNQVFESVAGIEIENSRHALVESNFFYNNTGGILAFITPGLPIKTCGDVLIRNNFVVDNNHEYFAIPGSLVSNIPQGTGVLLMACDDVVIEGNIITGNDSVGVTFTDFSLAGNAANDPDSDPSPNRCRRVRWRIWTRVSSLTTVCAPAVMPTVHE